jgi:predicted aminopeptidase
MDKKLTPRQKLIKDAVEIYIGYYLYGKITHDGYCSAAHRAAYVAAMRLGSKGVAYGDITALKAYEYYDNPVSDLAVSRLFGEIERTAEYELQHIFQYINASYFNFPPVIAPVTQNIVDKYPHLLIIKDRRNER